MDESDGLENRYGGNLVVGSNPTPSARIGMNKALQDNLEGFYIGPMSMGRPRTFAFCCFAGTNRLGDSNAARYTGERAFGEGC